MYFPIFQRLGSSNLYFSHFLPAGVLDMTSTMDLLMRTCSRLEFGCELSGERGRTQGQKFIGADHSRNGAIWELGAMVVAPQFDRQLPDHGRSNGHIDGPVLWCKFGNIPGSST